MSLWAPPSLAAPAAHKDAGNAAFKAGLFEESISAYAAGATAASLPALKGWPAAGALAVTCLSNKAQALLNLERPSEALEACDEALSSPCAATVPRVHGKLFSRRVAALEALERPGEARACVRRADAVGVAAGLEAAARRLDVALPRLPATAKAKAKTKGKTRGKARGATKGTTGRENSDLQPTTMAVEQCIRTICSTILAGPGPG